VEQHSFLLERGGISSGDLNIGENGHDAEPEGRCTGPKSNLTKSQSSQGTRREGPNKPEGKSLKDRQRGKALENEI